MCRPFLPLACALLALCGLGGCGDASDPLPPRAATLFAYNSSQELLAGDLWDITTGAAAARDLRELPPNWELVGLGTTDRDGANGEILALGSAGAPRLLWADPGRDGALAPLAAEQLPFLALAACDPSEAVTVPLPAATDLRAAVRAALARLGFELAAVRFEAQLTDVEYSVAYHLRKDGTPLGSDETLVSAYLRTFAQAPETRWWGGGFYAARAADRALLCRPGSDLALGGATTDGSRGGVFNKAQIVGGTLRVWPITTVFRRQADLTIKYGQMFGDHIIWHLGNLGQNDVSHTPVRVTVSGRTVYEGDLGRLRAGGTLVRQTLSLDAVGTAAVRVVADPDRAITEALETNNVWPPG